MNSSRESAAREQWMLDAARDVAAEIHFQKFSGGNMDSVVSATHPENAKFLDRRAKELAPIIARHYAAREREEWIPVSERLPRDRDIVNVLEKLHQDEPSVAQFRQGQWELWGIHGLQPLECVTHWRPLPLAPFAAKGETE